MAQIPEAARRFLDRYIDSVERLEVLLLLQRHADRTWTASATAEKLHIGTSAADAQLAKLCAESLLEVHIGSDLFYRFNPRPAHVAEGAIALAEAYDKQRLLVIQRIWGRPTAPIRDFANAFALKKKGGPDG